ncbi:hypothetical protein MJ904_07360 [Massilia sp. MB5]|uniref:hypothetical protein n=1 Tax=Massilia sp. MB5 TaxID=2919578 RepID=UPI001F115654|nr:hypothetical protein [Massilia sp. MB5]UMR31986.1 hypothetical protein MJ904_07360 [Massilia sp. MB5]
MNAKKEQRKGRPERHRFGRQQTKLWAHAVLVHAGYQDFKELELLLGVDGKWDGVWSRYSRGLKSPTVDRVMRIDKQLPGTASYFNSTFWSLLANNDIRWEVLQCATEELPAPLRKLSTITDSRKFGRCSLNTDDYLRLQYVLITSLMSPSYADGFVALIAALIAVREAELCRNELDYLRGCQVLARFAKRMYLHPVMRTFSRHWIEEVLEPLRTIQFVTRGVDDCWSMHRQRLVNKAYKTVESLDVLECLDSFEFCQGMQASLNW